MTRLIKTTLATKLKEIGSPFKYNDILIHKTNISNIERLEAGFDFIDRKYILVIKGYEDIKISIIIGYDNYFSHYCLIKDNILGIDIFDSSVVDVFTAVQKAVLHLGYTIHTFLERSGNQTCLK